MTFYVLYRYNVPQFILYGIYFKVNVINCRLCIVTGDFYVQFLCYDKCSVIAKRLLRVRYKCRLSIFWKLHNECCTWTHFEMISAKCYVYKLSYYEKIVRYRFFGSPIKMIVFEFPDFSEFERLKWNVWKVFFKVRIEIS